MLVNIAKAGFFSSDRTIEEYNRDIWKLETDKDQAREADVDGNASGESTEGHAASENTDKTEE